MPHVTISILAYDGLEHSKACLKSIFENTHGYDYELILTDNGSSDGTAEFFKEVQTQRPDSVRVVTNKENLGFIEPNKKALNMARGHLSCRALTTAVVSKTSPEEALRFTTTV